MWQLLLTVMEKGSKSLTTKTYDFLIIGAGIVGLSVAKQLTEIYPCAKVAILEKEKNIGQHASGRNSGVLHSGIYYPKDTLKASVCAEGAKKMLAFAKMHGISHAECGKLIVATSPIEVNTLNQLLQNAQNNYIDAKMVY